MRKTKEQRIEISDESFFAGLHECMEFDAASIRALALFLHEHKKSKERMKAASAEIGRNARYLVRAVDFFPFCFDADITYPDADDYLKLFCYAQLKRELATETYAKYRFDFPLWRTRELVDAAKPKREKKPKPFTERGKRYRDVVEVVAQTGSENLAFSAQMMLRRFDEIDAEIAAALKSDAS